MKKQTKQNKQETIDQMIIGAVCLTIVTIVIKSVVDYILD